jgi:putative ATPase
MIANATSRKFVELSAISSGVKDVREVIADSKDSLAVGGQNTVLFIDEVHRFNKSQQDALLPAVENGWVTLVAATTENPSFSINAPLLSRSIVVRLEKLQEDDLRSLVRRALQSTDGLNGEVALDDTGLDFLVRLAGGDARHRGNLAKLSVDDGACVGQLSRRERADARRTVNDFSSMERISGPLLSLSLS